MAYQIPEADVIFVEHNKEFVVYPLSDAARNACKKYKGVIMRSYTIPKGLIDRQQDYYSLFGATCSEVIWLD